MKKTLLIVLLIVAVAGLIYLLFVKPKKQKEASKKETPIAVYKHGDSLNIAVDTLMSSYYDMSEALSKGDIGATKTAAREFLGTIENFPLSELEQDTSVIIDAVTSNLNDLKLNTEALLSDKNISDMRKDFGMISQALYPAFFTAINYQGQTIYIHSCPTSFDDGTEGMWIDKDKQPNNPYQNNTQNNGGTNCAELKDSVYAK